MKPPREFSQFTCYYTDNELKICLFMLSGFVLNILVFLSINLSKHAGYKPDDYFNAQQYSFQYCCVINWFALVG